MGSNRMSALDNGVEAGDNVGSNDINLLSNVRINRLTRSEAVAQLYTS